MRWSDIYDEVIAILGTNGEPMTTAEVCDAVGWPDMRAGPTTRMATVRKALNKAVGYGVVAKENACVEGGGQAFLWRLAE